jgi:hypothetical protein
MATTRIFHQTGELSIAAAKTGKEMPEVIRTARRNPPLAFTGTKSVVVYFQTGLVAPAR